MLERIGSLSDVFAGCPCFAQQKGRFLDRHAITEAEEPLVSPKYASVLI